MIRFDAVSHGSLRSVSFEIAAGEAVGLVVPSTDRKNEVMRLLSGLEPPRTGAVYFFGQSLWGLTPADRIRLYRRVGIVPEGGGLISNLKVWENILLPAAYHDGRSADSAEGEVVAVFRGLGFTDADTARLMGRLPDALPVYERRLAALSRAMLTDADVLIYDYLFTGLEPAGANRLADMTAAFHGRKAGRVSLYVSPDDRLSERLRTDRTIRVG